MLRAAEGEALVLRMCACFCVSPGSRHLSGYPCPCVHGLLGEALWGGNIFDFNFPAFQSHFGDSNKVF